METCFFCCFIIFNYTIGCFALGAIIFFSETSEHFGGLQNVTRASISITASRNWVKFQFVWTIPLDSLSAVKRFITSWKELKTLVPLLTHCKFLGFVLLTTTVSAVMACENQLASRWFRCEACYVFSLAGLVGQKRLPLGGCFLSVKLNAYVDSKISPEPPSTSGGVVNGWNSDFGWTIPLGTNVCVCVCGIKWFRERFYLK